MGLATARATTRRKSGGSISRPRLPSLLATSIALSKKRGHVAVDLHDRLDASFGARPLRRLGDAPQDVAAGLFAVRDRENLHRRFSTFGLELVLEDVEGHRTIFVLPVGHDDDGVDAAGL